MSPTREIQKEFPSQEFPRAQFDTAQTTNKPNQKQEKAEFAENSEDLHSRTSSKRCPKDG